tara:strand:+ start:204 stop:446 length:243 start_codon:yes stop_codon:yes gene_type:complete
MMETSSADEMRGIAGGSDRAAAVGAAVKAVGSSLNHFSFTSSEHDIIVELEAPSVASMMGVKPNCADVSLRFKKININDK